MARTGGWTVALCDTEGWPVGALLPDDPFEQRAVSPDGHNRGGPRVERAVGMVVQKPDGTSDTLTPREFEQKYRFANDPDKVRLTD